MSGSMRELHDIASAHMWRDMQAARKWICTCDACREIRALVGMDKLLGVWPLVRAVQDVEDQLKETPDGPEKQALRQQQDKLYDLLAAEMAPVSYTHLTLPTKRIV